MLRFVLGSTTDGSPALTGYLDSDGLAALRSRLDLLGGDNRHVHLEDLLDPSPSSSGRPVITVFDVVVIDSHS
jgi:hypothetical protein